MCGLGQRRHVILGQDQPGGWFDMRRENHIRPRLAYFRHNLVDGNEGEARVGSVPNLAGDADGRLEVNQPASKIRLQR